MISGFWQRLKKPFFALAPMYDVTDAAFRRLIGKYGKPDVFFTEFTSADGLCSKDGRWVLESNLLYTEAERPIVAQLFGARPEKMRQAARLVKKLGFDGLDINMGCPDRAVEKQGAGAALMKNPELAKRLIEAARSGAANLPISVKTRIGYDKNELKNWLPVLLGSGLAAITIHARSRKEMSAVPARWEAVAEAVGIRDKIGSSTLIIGNGDVPDLAVAGKRADETGADGVMLGRAIFGNPWLFSNSQEFENERGWEAISRRLRVMVEHAKLFEKIFGRKKNFAVMKKHFKAYVSGWDGVKELRMRLMEAENPVAVQKIVSDYLNALK
jgi:nifR3 family TIM-barrel protein